MRISVITGPMFSGKTTRLLKEIEASFSKGVVTQVFKSSLDNRYELDYIVSHTGGKTPCIPVHSGQELKENIIEEAKHIFIDEGNFFREDLIEICEDLAKKGVFVTIAGLDKNYVGLPFNPTMLLLLAIADNVTKLKASCYLCGKEASFTQKFSTINKDLIECGGSSIYRPCCRSHFEVIP